MSRVEGSTEPGGQAEGWLDRALGTVDRVSERASFEMFRFGIYVTMPALVVLVTLDVMLRYVFNAPLQWARDVNGILLLITIFCALPHAWDRAYHIRMEVFYSRFTTARRRIADVLSSLAGVVFFGMMAVQAARFVPFMVQTGETGEDLELVLWPFMAIVSLCAVVMVARVFANPAGTEGRLEHWLRSQEPPDGGEGGGGGSGGEPSSSEPGDAT